MTLTGDQLAVAFLLFTVVLLVASALMASVYYTVRAVKGRVPSRMVFETTDVYRAYVNSYLKKNGIPYKIKARFGDIGPYRVYTAVEGKDEFDIIYENAAALKAKEVYIRVSVELPVKVERVSIDMQVG